MAINNNNSDNSLPESVVPEVVIQRLPLYVRVLTQFSSAGEEVISSEQLGTRLQMTPAQIRKDLSYFGRFGKQGRGYNISMLEEKLRTILGLDRTWNAAVIGMGRLGRAVVSYPGFAPEGFNILAAFDASDEIVGQTISGLQVESISQLSQSVIDHDIKIGIVTVPIDHAQEVIDALVEAGIKSILNYAPLSPQVPEGVTVRGIDPVLSLQSMTYYIK
ncbi:MAG: redox-sensing transcriptional repressor Rex [Chloroflexi bacterium]|jgi:redox-sensing transcriptional repressor|nr:redox-sensing transcriptional repressor Rex [Chloroflexota bacterium]MBT5626672.1 redox-sensing transcriptional repressor Rex [Chloroflexota bacterium]